MSYAVGVNVRLYASDKSSPRHEVARRFVQQCAAGPDVFCLAWPTVMAYLRIATRRFSSSTACRCSTPSTETS